MNLYPHPCTKAVYGLRIRYGLKGIQLECGRKTFYNLIYSWLYLHIESLDGGNRIWTKKNVSNTICDCAHGHLYLYNIHTYCIGSFEAEIGEEMNIGENLSLSMYFMLVTSSFVKMEQINLGFCIAEIIAVFRSEMKKIIGKLPDFWTKSRENKEIGDINLNATVEINFLCDCITLWANSQGCALVLLFMFSISIRTQKLLVNILSIERVIMKSMAALAFSVKVGNQFEEGKKHSTPKAFMQQPTHYIVSLTHKNANHTVRCCTVANIFIHIEWKQSVLW